MQLNDNDFQNVDNCDLVSKNKISSTKIVSFLTYKMYLKQIKKNFRIEATKKNQK